jgi:antitoxin PrlF
MEHSLMSYKGKITTSGTSEAIRLEKDLFIQHPEFKQAATVKADIIGQGTMLISVVDKSNIENDNDPIVGAFLSFLEKDMSKNAAAITALDAKTISQAKALTAGVTVTDDELD